VTASPTPTHEHAVAGVRPVPLNAMRAQCTTTLRPCAHMCPLIHLLCPFMSRFSWPVTFLTSQNLKRPLLRTRLRAVSCSLRDGGCHDRVPSPPSYWTSRRAYLDTSDSKN